jgi:hypothetical protein
MPDFMQDGLGVAVPLRMRIALGRSRAVFDNDGNLIQQ